MAAPMVPLPLPQRRRLPALPPPLLLLGLGLSTTLVVAWLGLRSTVLLVALAPPVRASSRRRDSAPAVPLLSRPLWRQRSQQLEEIRALALALAQRDPHATVDLLVLLEELLERLPQADAEGALERDLERVRQQLASPAWTAATLPSRGRP